MVTPPAVTKEDLSRYVDDRLAQERRARVAAYLREHLEMSDELEEQKRLNALLRKRYKSLREEVIPQALLHADARGPDGRARPRRAALRAVAVAAAAAVMGGAVGWLWRSALLAPQWQDFTRQAAAAYRVYTAERERPVELAAPEELLAWLSRRLGMPIVAPKLDQFGYRFLGGRLLPTAGGAPAAQLMYENADRRRLTLYIRADLRNRREIEFQLERQGDVNVLYWLDGPRAYALASQLDESAMLPLAKRVYDTFRL